ncbi:MAG: carbohydrate ABC transporter permease [Clostridiaceae bacterium]|nr:carbohydrate ABC transporter permease [Clostridiaceae bacterium]
MKDGKSKLRLKKKIFGFDIVNFVILLILTLIALFPMYYVVLVSLADYASVHKQGLYILPTTILFDSYKTLLSTDLFTNAAMVSVFITITGTVLSMILSSAAAYVLSKKQIPGQKILFSIILIPMFFSGGLIPYYLTIKDIGLIDNIWVLVIPGAISSYYLILLKNFFEGFPVSIEEAAKIDGANDIYILAKLVLPMSAPIIATISLFYAVDKWNDYYTALMYLTNRKIFPLQLVLREAILDFNQVIGSSVGAQLARENSTVYSQGMQMAMIVISTVPIFCVYPFLQRYFTKGLMLGAVKE